MVGSDEDEAEDSVSDLPRPPLKKMRWDFEGMATDPEDFISFLSKIGFQLRFDDQPNVLSVQGSVFQQTLREHLTSNNHGPKSIDIFVSRCDAFFGQRENFIKALQPTEESFDLLFDKGFSSSFGAEPKQSLIHLLLDITEVQPKLMQCLLERFTVAWEEENLRTEENLPSLILSQLAGLSRIVNPFYIAHVLLNGLNSASPDTHHLLTTAILKIFGELGLPPKDAVELRAQVIQRFLNMPFESIPSLMAFVFNNISSEESGSLIRQVRRDFDQAFSRERKRRNIHSHLAYRKDHLRRILLDEKYIDCLVLAVVSIHESLKHSKTLADIWLQDIQVGSTYYLIDVLVLLEEQKKYPVRVERLFYEKLRSKSMTVDLIIEAIKLYDLVLNNYFDPLRVVVNSILFSKDPLVIPCGSLLYLGWFSHSDVTDQQKIVETLVRSISGKGESASKSGRKAEGSLTAYFASLNSIPPLELLDLPAVKFVIDLIVKMVYGIWDASLSQNRSWFSLYSESDFSFVFQLLGSPIAATKRIGVYCAVSLLTVISDIFWGGTVLVGEPAVPLSQDQRIQLARSCVHLFHGCIEQPPEVAAFFVNEIARIQLNQMHPFLHAFLIDSICETFLNSFVVDEDEQPLSTFSVKLTPQLGLHILDVDESNNKPLFLNIAPMTFEETRMKPGDQFSTKASVTTMVSYFQLLRTVDNQGKAVRLMDALLGCPLCLPDDDVLNPDVFDSLAQPVKDAVCRSLFHAVNWLIEVISTFVNAKPMRSKVIKRIRDVILLKDKYYCCLVQNPESLSVAPGNALLSPNQRLQLAQNLMDLVQGCTEPVTKVPALFADEMVRPPTLNEMHPVLHAYLYDQASGTLQNVFSSDEDDKLAVQLGKDKAVKVQSNIDAMKMNEARKQTSDQFSGKALASRSKNDVVSTLETNHQEKKPQSDGLKKTCDYFSIAGSIRERMDKVEEQLIDQDVDASTAAGTAFITVLLNDACYLLKGRTVPLTEVPALFAEGVAWPSTLKQMHPILHAYLNNDVSYELQNSIVSAENDQLALKMETETVENDTSNNSNIDAMTINKARQEVSDRSICNKALTTKSKNDVVSTLKTNHQEKKPQSIGLKKTCDYFRIAGPIRERMNKMEEQLVVQGVDADFAAATAFTTVMLDDVFYLLKMTKQSIAHHIH